ncbi:MAG: cation:proton antiporter [Candidatus Altiarchaeota archaeon]
MESAVGIVALIVAGGIISLELGISTAILEIVAGVVGSNFLHLHDIPWLDFLANFGLLGIMFFAGFETDVNIIRRYLSHSLAIALASFLTPFISTFILAYYILGLSTIGSLLVGIGMSTTSLALVFPYLKGEGLLDRNEGQALLAAAMFVDVFSMVSLSLLASGFDTYSIGFLVMLVPAFFVLPHVGHWLFDRYEENAVELELRFILLCLVALSFLSEHAGIHAAILAYASGIVLARLFVGREELEQKLRGITFGFLGPVFFFNAGYRMNLTAVTFGTIEAFLALTVVAFSAKYVGTRWSVKRILGRGSRLSGLFFNFRLSFGIVTALLGFELGFIDQTIYTALLGTILATSIISSFFLKITPTETFYFPGPRWFGKQKRYNLSDK